MNFIKTINFKILVSILILVSFLLFIFFLIIENLHSNNVANQIQKSMLYSMAKSDAPSIYNNANLYTSLENVGCIEIFKFNKKVMSLKSEYCDAILSKKFLLRNSQNSEFTMSIAVFPSPSAKLQVFILSIAILILISLVYILLDVRRMQAQEKTLIQLKSQLSNWMNLCEEKDLVCKQIYHDLASPLGLMQVAVLKIEDNKIARPFALSLDRLNKISEDLKSQKYIWNSATPTLSSIKNILDNILQEKNILTSNMNINYKIITLSKSEELKPDIPVSQLSRVLSNILNNAIEAIQPNGQIKLLLRSVSCKKRIDIIVSDSGEGISPNISPFIFDKDRTFNKNNGSGLGLYHAKRCIEYFGGKIVLLNTSRKRKHGASFLISIPYVKDFN